MACWGREEGRGEGFMSGQLTFPPGDTVKELDVRVSPGAG